jgi:hypothetical protein
MDNQALDFSSACRSLSRREPQADRETLVFVDCETAGLQPWRPIMQLAAIAINHAGHELEVFEHKIRFDEKQAVQRTLRKRHYNRRRWQREGQPAQDVAIDFGRFLLRHATLDVPRASGKPLVMARLVAHNAQFDGPFLRTWFQRLGLFYPGAYHVFCTMQRAMWLFHEDPLLTPPADFKLGTLCEYFGVPWNAAEAHDALADVRATVGLFRAMRQHGQQRQRCAG